MPRKRVQRNDYLVCCLCQATFCETAEFHQLHCSSIQKRHLDYEAGNNDFCFQQNYIRNRILYGSVQESKELSKDNLNCKKIVLMHPSTMGLCRISIYGYVVIQSYDTQNVYIAFPNDKINKTAVSFCDSKQKRYKHKEKVKVFSYHGNVLDAETVLLSSASSNELYTAEFKKFLMRDMWNTHIYCGMLIRGMYEGSTFELFIKHIKPKTHYASQAVDETKNITKSEECSPSLNSTFSKLSLNDSKLDETKFYSIQDSSFFESSHAGTSIHSTPTRNMCIDSSNTSSFQSFESSTLNFKRKFYFHEDLNEYFTFTSMTAIQIEPNEKMTKATQEHSGTTFKNIGGLQEQQKIVKDYLEVFFASDSTHGLSHGMVFHGPSGVGKTYLAETIANEFNVNFIKVVATDIYLKNYFNKENQLKCVFKEAKERCPCIIFIDELDLLCEMFPNDKNGIVSTLGHLMDEVTATESKIFILTAVTTISAVDDSLRKIGRFEMEVKFQIPGTKDREEILLQLLRKGSHNLTEEQIHEIAECTHGFTGFNLACMCREAELESCNKQSSDVPKAVIDFKNLEQSMGHIKPHVLKDDKYFFQKVRWEDIGGMEEVKKKLRQVVEFPLLHPELFKRFGMAPSRGILLYGPPGCSKTMIAKALATESSLNFIPIKGAELFSKWVGDSEKAIRDLFKRAKEAAPCIIFFDEIDSLVSDRGSSGGSDVDNRVVTQLLTEVDGAEELEGVIIVAATNRPDRLDPAMLRPGRLDHLIYIPLPDADTRKAIFSLKFKTMPVGDDVNIEELVQRTHGYSGAEVVAVCHEAGFFALSEDFPNVVENPIIKKQHWEKAINRVKPRISTEIIEYYETFMTQAIS